MSPWSTQQDADGLWSAHSDGQFRAGSFGTKEQAEIWIKTYIRTQKAEDKGLWVELSYCCPATFGQSYSAGSRRMWSNDIATWLIEQLHAGKPVLISEIRTIENHLTK